MEKIMFKSFSNYISERRKGPSVKQEYLDDQGKLVEKPKVRVVADYDGPDPKSPPKSKGAEDGAPYRPANAAEKAKKPESGGFADLGDKKLVYDPKTEGGSSKMTVLGTEIGSDWPKTKTENFLHATKNMSSSQFAKYMLESCACDMSNVPTVSYGLNGKHHPHPSEAVRYVTAITGQNIKLMESLVFEMKAQGNLSMLLAVMLEHRDTYNALTNLLEDEEFGPTRAKHFARALSEAVGPPMGFGDEEEEVPPEEGEEGEEGPPMDGEEAPPEEGDDLGDLGGEEGEEEEDMPPEEGEEDDMGGEEDHDPFADDDEHPLDKLHKKMPPPKKKFNLGAAMGNFESIKHALKSYLN